MLGQQAQRHAFATARVAVDHREATLADLRVLDAPAKDLLLRVHEDRESPAIPHCAMTGMAGREPVKLARQAAEVATDLTRRAFANAGAIQRKIRDSLPQRGPVTAIKSMTYAQQERSVYFGLQMRPSLVLPYQGFQYSS